jgi:hypothetical protein
MELIATYLLSVEGVALIGLCYLPTVVREARANKVRVISSIIRAEFIDDIPQSSTR